MKAEPCLDFPSFHQDSSALIKKHLSPEIYSALKPIATPSGFTLEKAFRSGVIHPDSSIGIYAGDIQSYTLFSKILDPIIKDYHGLNKPPAHQSEVSSISLPPLDTEGRYIKSFRIRVARSLEAFPFCCHMELKHRLRVVSEVKDALATLPEDLSGRYISYSDLSPEPLADLVNQRLGFPKGDRFQEGAGMNRDFPHGRGVFISSDQQFRVWVNEEDHLRIMAVGQTSDMAGVFDCLIQGLNHLEERLGFSFDPKLGYLNACPTNIGTAMRAGVHIRLKKLEKNQDLLNKLITQYQLQIRGTGGEKTSVEKGIFDISNKQRLGIPETKIIQNIHSGLAAIIKAEKSL